MGKWLAPLIAELVVIASIDLQIQAVISPLILQLGVQSTHQCLISLSYGNEFSQTHH